MWTFSTYWEPKTLIGSLGGQGLTNLCMEVWVRFVPCKITTWFNPLSLMSHKSCQLLYLITIKWVFKEFTQDHTHLLKVGHVTQVHDHFWRFDYSFEFPCWFIDYCDGFHIIFGVIFWCNFLNVIENEIKVIIEEGMMVTRAIMNQNVMMKTRKMKFIFVDMSLSMSYRVLIEPTKIK